MSAYEEDLDFNPFYKALQGEFSSSFCQARNCCCVICVPQISSISSVSEFKSSFVEEHILRPSPLFKGKFVTLNKQKSLKYRIENGTVLDIDGLPVKILSEEHGYNKDSKRYSILIIERPLTGACAPQKVPPQVKADPLEPRVSPLECRDFINSFMECNQVIAELEKLIHQFVRNYMILKGYLAEAACKLNKIYEDVSEKFMAELRFSLAQDERVTKNIRRAIENYLIGCVQAKLWPVVNEECHETDVYFLTKTAKLQYYRDADTEKLISCDLTKAVSEVSSLDDKETSIQKMMCISATIESITASVNAHIHKINSKDSIFLTSDDYISLLVHVLIQARPKHLASNIFFMEKFQWAPLPCESLSYNMVTFRAAVEFIKTLDIKHSPAPDPQESQTETSMVSTCQTTSKLMISSSPVSRRKRQQERINKMLESDFIERYDMS